MRLPRNYLEDRSLLSFIQRTVEVGMPPHSPMSSLQLRALNVASRLRMHLIRESPAAPRLVGELYLRLVAILGQMGFSPQQIQRSTIQFHVEAEPLPKEEQLELLDQFIFRLRAINQESGMGLRSLRAVVELHKRLDIDLLESIPLAWERIDPSHA